MKKIIFGIIVSIVLVGTSQSVFATSKLKYHKARQNKIKQNSIKQKRNRREKAEQKRQAEEAKRMKAELADNPRLDSDIQKEIKIEASSIKQKRNRRDIEKRKVLEEKVNEIQVKQNTIKHNNKPKKDKFCKRQSEGIGICGMLVENQNAWNELEKSIVTQGATKSEMKTAKSHNWTLKDTDGKLNINTREKMSILLKYIDLQYDLKMSTYSWCPECGRLEKAKRMLENYERAPYNRFRQDLYSIEKRIRPLKLSNEDLIADIKYLLIKYKGGNYFDQFLDLEASFNKKNRLDKPLERDLDQLHRYLKHMASNNDVLADLQFQKKQLKLIPDEIDQVYPHISEFPSKLTLPVIRKNNIEDVAKLIGTDASGYSLLKIGKDPLSNGLKPFQSKKKLAKQYQWSAHIPFKNLDKKNIPYKTSDGNKKINLHAVSWDYIENDVYDSHPLSQVQAKELTKREKRFDIRQGNAPLLSLSNDITLGLDGTHRRAASQQGIGFIRKINANSNSLRELVYSLVAEAYHSRSKIELKQYIDQLIEQSGKEKSTFKNPYFGLSNKKDLTKNDSLIKANQKLLTKNLPEEYHQDIRKLAKKYSEFWIHSKLGKPIFKKNTTEYELFSKRLERQLEEVKELGNQLYIKISDDNKVQQIIRENNDLNKLGNI